MCSGLKHLPSPCGQWELCWYPILSSILADENRERTANSNQCTAHRIWRNKGASPKSGHSTSDSRRLPSADHQWYPIPSCWLFICIQCHNGSSYFEFMEGRDLNLPFDDQVTYQARSGRSKRGSSGSTRMLRCHVGNGRSFVDYVYKRTTDDSRIGGRIGRSTLWRV